MFHPGLVALYNRNMTESDEIPIGLCKCGCGRATKIATRSSKQWGYRKGEPFNFLQGHGAGKGEGNRIANLKKRTGKMVSCAACGKEYYLKPFYESRGRKKYCSVKCAKVKMSAPRPSQLRPRMLTCSGCGKDFERKWPSQCRVKEKTRVFCSRECSSEHNVGANNPGYRGMRHDDRGPRWNHISEEIRVRDGRICRACGAVEPKRKFQVDHIVPYRLMIRFKLPPNDPINLMTLCHSCHPKKTAVESKILKGDVIGFLDGMRSIVKVDIDSVQAALRFAGLH